MASKTFGQMRIRLTNLEIDRTNLQIEAKGLCRSTSEILVPELTEIEDMDVAKARDLVEDLVMKQAELLGLQRKIYELEQALGN